MIKKLLVVAAIFCAAVAAQAEQSWTVINAGAYDGYKIDDLLLGSAAEDYDQHALSDFNEYFLDDSALAMTESKTWAQHYAVVSELFAMTTVENGTASGNFSGIEFAQSAVFMLCPDGVAPGEEYVLTKTLYDTSKNNTFDFTNVEVLASGTFRTDSVPEPTSGLLLLLGVAGLALKRKQK